MKKLWKILLAIGALIAGILAFSSKGGKKKFKKDLKENKNKVDAVKVKSKKINIAKKKNKKKIAIMEKKIKVLKRKKRPTAKARKELREFKKKFGKRK